MSTFESDKTDLPFSGPDLPEYAGLWLLGARNFSPDKANYSPLLPAAGSVDLIAPRSIGGESRPNLTPVVVGPVTAHDRGYTNLNTDFVRQTSNPQGPNKGGQDANIGAYMAYQASQIQALTQAESAAAITGRH